MNTQSSNCLRVGMVGAGMIFDETYRPAFEISASRPIGTRTTGPVEVRLAGIASKSGKRAESFRERLRPKFGDFAILTEPGSVQSLLDVGVDAVCVATPDDRHFEASKAVLTAGKHLLVEKPSVLTLGELDELVRIAKEKKVLAKVVYHKLLDPDHKKLRTLVADGILQHCNNGYCSLLEPKSIAMGQFGEWIGGRNPGTYVAVHYIKLIDFTFGGRLRAVTATGQRGIVREAAGDTWDSVQLRLLYEDGQGRESAYDIHTSWVTPDNFPGYVEQEVQFRFDNGVWNGHSRKRGVEVTIEGMTPTDHKITVNNHYNATSLEPWGERTQRGYGIEVIQRFFEEVAEVELGGPQSQRAQRLRRLESLAYNDLSADRQVVAAVQALEAILKQHACGAPDAVARIDKRGLVLLTPGSQLETILYAGTV